MHSCAVSKTNMLRVFLDEHGSGSNDLFVKIDGSPTWVWVVDTSWLGFFSGTEDNPVLTEDKLMVAKKADVASLIQFWQKMLLSDQTICYLPYCLWDQGGGAFQVTKRKKLYHITPVWNPDTTEGMTQSQFLRYQESTPWQRSGEELEWELAPSSILTGLTWSLAQLEQPIVPLRYT